MANKERVVWDLILDCESENSTYRSLSNLFKCSKKELISLLADIDVDSSPDILPDEYIFQKAIERFGDTADPEFVCWFHLTRTTPDNTFKQGILPLGNALNGIWEVLNNIFKDSVHQKNLTALKETGVKNYHYNLKTPTPFHWGPYAMLIREAAFKSKEMGNHDYLWLPEIIEDICNAYCDEFGTYIHDDVVESLKPCIVKFKSPYSRDDGCVSTALYYLHACIKKEGMRWDTNTCFDGEATTIPYENILSIEFIDEPNKSLKNFRG